MVLTNGSSFFSNVTYDQPMLGPASPAPAQRLSLLRELLDANVLFTVDRWASKNNAEDASAAARSKGSYNPIVALHSICQERGLPKPKFKYISKSAISASEGVAVLVYKCSVRVESAEGYVQFAGQGDDWVMNKTLALHAAAMEAYEKLTRRPKQQRQHQGAMQSRSAPTLDTALSDSQPNGGKPVP